jgi:hypothetical protein
MDKINRQRNLEVDKIYRCHVYRDKTIKELNFEGKLLENWKSVVWKYKKCLKNNIRTKRDKTGGCSSLGVCSTATLAPHISVIDSYSCITVDLLIILRPFNFSDRACFWFLLPFASLIHQISLLR